MNEETAVGLATNPVGNCGGLMSIAKSSNKKNLRYYHAFPAITLIECKQCSDLSGYNCQILNVREEKFKAFKKDRKDIIFESKKKNEKSKKQLASN